MESPVGRPRVRLGCRCSEPALSTLLPAAVGSLRPFRSLGCQNSAAWRQSMFVAASAVLVLAFASALFASLLPRRWIITTSLVSLPIALLGSIMFLALTGGGATYTIWLVVGIGSLVSSAVAAFLLRQSGSPTAVQAVRSGRTMTVRIVRLGSDRSSAMKASHRPVARPRSRGRSIEPSRTIRTVIVRPLRTAWTAVGEPLWRSKTLRQPRTPSCRFPQRAIWCKSHRTSQCEEHDRAEKRNRQRDQRSSDYPAARKQRSKQRGSECQHQDRRSRHEHRTGARRRCSGSPENEKGRKDPTAAQQCR